MTSPRDATVAAALADLLRGDPARPFVTWVGAGGVRTELSLRTYDNNVAKAANLLRDEVDAGPGTVVALRLPVHWQTSVWIGACALVGALADVGGDPADSDVAVLAPGHWDGPQARELTLATSLHPFGLPCTDPLPAGVLDAAVEVRAHGDRFAPGPPLPGTTAWLRRDGEELAQGAALDAARALAEGVGLGAGGRLLCARDLDPRAVLALLAVPLVVGGSVVLLTDANADPAEVARTERCDALLGPA